MTSQSLHPNTAILSDDSGDTVVGDSYEDELGFQLADNEDPIKWPRLPKCECA
jgi:hypothetical protein